MNKWCMLYLSVGLSGVFADSLPNLPEEKQNKKPYLLLYPHKAVYILPFYHSLIKN